jgi:hypothetical protein
VVSNCFLSYGSICGGDAWGSPSQICVSLGEVSILFRSYIVVPPSGFSVVQGLMYAQIWLLLVVVEDFSYLVRVMPEL